MMEDAPDIGSPEPSAFVGLERDALGRPVACFVTRDGESFALGAEALELRIAYLERQRLETAEERRALRELAASF